jgi:orotate phosphoribosyltransferase
MTNTVYEIRANEEVTEAGGDVDKAIAAVERQIENADTKEERLFMMKVMRILENGKW